MARYINKDEFIAQIQDNFCAECNNYDGVKCKSCGIDDTIEMVENADEADVVPKSEVAEIIEETFKRIRENFVNTPICKVALFDLEAELKNKYTEGERHEEIH